MQYTRVGCAKQSCDKHNGVCCYACCGNIIAIIREFARRQSAACWAMYAACSGEIRIFAFGQVLLALDFNEAVLEQALTWGRTLYLPTTLISTGR